MTKDVSQLLNVANARWARINANTRLEAEAKTWLANSLKPYDQAINEAVMEALDEGHTVTAVAEAYTVSGKSPDRNAIQTIKREALAGQELWSGSYPFEWRAREVETAAGNTTVYDVVADLEEFGPDAVSGGYKWLYDRITHELDPVFGEGDPYPITTKYYKQVLNRWLMNNPYPGEL